MSVKVSLLGTQGLSTFPRVAVINLGVPLESLRALKTVSVKGQLPSSLADLEPGQRFL